MVGSGNSTSILIEALRRLIFCFSTASALGLNTAGQYLLYQIFALIYKILAVPAGWVAPTCYTVTPFMCMLSHNLLSEAARMMERFPYIDTPILICSLTVPALQYWKCAGAKVCRNLNTNKKPNFLPAIPEGAKQPLVLCTPTLSERLEVKV